MHSSCFIHLRTVHGAFPVFLFSVDIATASEQLRWLFSVLLTVRPLDSTPFINTLTMSISRLPLLSTSVIIPPILVGMGVGVVTEKILDQSLNDADVLIEYMQRINLIGWTSKSQFEERWMQLLGVLNTPPPNEGDHCYCSC